MRLWHFTAQARREHDLHIKPGTFRQVLAWERIDKGLAISVKCAWPSPGVSDVRFAFRPARRLHLDERQPCRLAGRQAACSVARTTLCVLRVRGRACLWRPHFQVHGAFGAVPEPRRNCSISRSLIPSTELDAIEAAQVVDNNNLQNCYVRPVAWRGSEMMAVAAQNSTINVAIAVWDWPSMFDIETKDERHQARYRGIPAARSRDRALPRQGRRTLHDLHHLETSRRAARLRRRHDARLAGPRRRMHRRQYFLHP